MSAKDLEHMKPVKTGYDKWWHEKGSGVAPGQNFPDLETWAKYICRKAYEAGKNERHSS